VEELVQLLKWLKMDDAVADTDATLESVGGFGAMSDALLQQFAPSWIPPHPEIAQKALLRSAKCDR
jgi:hypothetical protein